MLRSRVWWRVCYCTFTGVCAVSCTSSPWFATVALSTILLHIAGTKQHNPSSLTFSDPRWDSLRSAGRSQYRNHPSRCLPSHMQASKKEQAPRRPLTWFFSIAVREASRLNLAFLLTSLLLLVLTLFVRYTDSIVKTVHLESEIEALHGDIGSQFWVSDYLAWHSRNRHSAARVLVFNPGNTILGSNIQALLHTYAMAVLSDRLVLINWTAPFPLSNVISSRAQDRFTYDFRRHSRHAEHAQITVDSRYDKTRRQELYDVLKGPIHTVVIRASSNALAEPPFSESPASRWNGAAIPPFTDQIRRKVAHVLLEPSAAMIDTLTVLNSRYEFCIGNNAKRFFSRFKPCEANTKPYIAVYADFGIVSGDRDRQQIPESGDRDVRFAKCFARQVKAVAEDSEPRVFIAAAMPHLRPLIKKLILRKLPNAQVSHFEHNIHHYARRGGGSDRGREAMVALHIEMRMIGSAQEIVSFPSEFARAAFSVGEARSYKAFSPDSCTNF